MKRFGDPFFEFDEMTAKLLFDAGDYISYLHARGGEERVNPSQSTPSCGQEPYGTPQVRQRRCEIYASVVSIFYKSETLSCPAVFDSVGSKH